MYSSIFCLGVCAFSPPFCSCYRMLGIAVAFIVPLGSVEVTEMVSSLLEQDWDYVLYCAVQVVGFVGIIFHGFYLCSHATVQYR
jgi:hypothetical protein